jgi:two-component system sensor histidine kinase ResE
MNLTMNDTYEYSAYLAKIHAEKDPPTGVSVAVTLDPEKLKNHIVIADRDRINQVVANLIINAKKFSGSGDSIMLSFAIDEADETYRVSIADEGIGISEEDISHIFERFFSKSSAYGLSGTGIGLTLSKEIVEAHKGQLSVESAEGEGSTFTFTLPLYVAN